MRSGETPDPSALALIAERELVEIRDGGAGWTEIVLRDPPEDGGILLSIDADGNVYRGGIQVLPLKPGRPSVDRLEQLLTMRYRDFLASPEWAARRRYVRSLADGCERCGSPLHPQVHHRTYEHRGCEQDGELELLCGDCHRDEHGIA